MPTQQDIDDLTAEMEEMKAAFANDTNDTAFVAENADGQVRGLIRYSAEKDVNPALRDTISKAAIGSVFGPVNEGDRMVIYKLSNKKTAPDSVRASHILISVNDGDTNKINTAKAKLDSLKSVAEKSKNFDVLAKEFSEDFGSAEKGGDLDWFTRGRMVAPFEKACFEGKKGDMTIVVSQFGVHLISITDQTTYKPQYLLAGVDRFIEPSKATSDEAYKQASKFSMEHKTVESFDAEESNMVQPIEGIRMVDENIGPMEGARDIVRWLYEAEVGDVSSPFESERFFGVAIVTSINAEGTMSLENAKNLMYAEVVNEKKAASIISEIGSAGSVQEAANKMGTDMKTANNVSFSQASLPGGLGREMKVLGAAFNLPEGQVSAPIVGNRGVFVIQVASRTIGEVSADLANTKRVESGNVASRVDSQVYNALKEVAGVKDQRARYY
jgi:peptidyl-prolyl cis-trans isomerase D